MSSTSSNSPVSSSTSPEPLTSNPAAALSSQSSPTFVSLRTWLSEPVVASFMAGGVAGAVSRTVVSPLERLKILYQIQSVGRNEYKMPIHRALGKIWKEEGFAGFMKGNGSNCIRIVPYSAIQFASYNFYKRFFESNPGSPLNPLQRLSCGAIAGITSVFFTYPLDIVRTRLSIQSASFEGLAKAEAGKKLPGMGQLLKQMYVEEGGITALYRGIIPTVAGVAPYVSWRDTCVLRKC